MVRGSRLSFLLGERDSFAHPPLHSAQQVASDTAARQELRESAVGLWDRLPSLPPLDPSSPAPVAPPNTSKQLKMIVAEAKSLLELFDTVPGVQSGPINEDRMQSMRDEAKARLRMTIAMCSTQSPSTPAITQQIMTGLSISRQVDDQVLLAQFLSFAAVASLESGDAAQATKLYEEAIALCSSDLAPLQPLFRFSVGVCTTLFQGGAPPLRSASHFTLYLRQFVVESASKDLTPANLISVLTSASSLQGQDSSSWLRYAISSHIIGRALFDAGAWSTARLYLRRAQACSKWASKGEHPANAFILFPLLLSDHKIVVAIPLGFHTAETVDTASKQLVEKLDSAATEATIVPEPLVVEAVKEKEEEEEDWDLEFALEESKDEAQPSGVFGMLKGLLERGKQVEEEESRVPEQFLLPAFEDQGGAPKKQADRRLQIVRYPKPTLLFSIRTSGNARLLQEKELEAWLQNLISKHEAGVRALRSTILVNWMSDGVESISAEDLIMRLEAERRYVDPLSKEWAEANLRCVRGMYEGGMHDECWAMLRVFLSEAGRWNDRTDRYDERLSVFFVVLQACYLAAKLWRPPPPKGVPNLRDGYLLMLESACRCAPPGEWSDAVRLIELETYAQGLSRTPSKMIDSIIPTLMSIYHRTHQPQEPESFLQVDAEPEPASKGLLRFVEKPQRSPSRDRLPLVRSLSITGDSPKLLLDGVSPPPPTRPRRTSRTSIDSVGPEPEPTVSARSHVAAVALADLHLHMCGLSPLTTSPLANPEDGEESEEEEVVMPEASGLVEANTGSESDELVVDVMKRGEKLFDLYAALPYHRHDSGSEEPVPLMRKSASRGLLLSQPTDTHAIDPNTPQHASCPLCFGKAKVAFALSVFARDDLGDNALAEQMLFESLFILDQSNQSHGVGKPATISQLATNALVDYGEALLTNDKYRYAILSFEAVRRSMDLRQKEEDQVFLRRLAVVSAENDDWKRSKEYYERILQKCRKEKKVNEIVHISLVVAGMHLDRGSFASAEAYMLNAASYLPTIKEDEEDVRVDSLYCNLVLKLAQQYLSSYGFERAIDLLMRFKGATLPHGKKAAFQTLLARALCKKRWYSECQEALGDLGKSGDGMIERTGSIKQTVSPSVARVSLATMLETGRNLRLLELAAKNHFYAHRPTLALNCVAKALNECPDSNLAARARLFYLRGKVFGELSRTSTNITFPYTCEGNVDSPTVVVARSRGHRRTASAAGGKPAALNGSFTTTGELLDECVSMFRRSYDYYRIMGDDIHVAKVVCSIAEAYLTRVYPLVALFGISYDEAASLKGSTVISLSSIEQPATLAVEICADTAHAPLMIRAYLNMAELSFLQGKKSLATAYWREARDSFFNMYMDGPVHVLGSGAPPGILSRHLRQLERMVLFLFSLDASIIEQNVMLLDAFVLLQKSLQQSLQRSLCRAPTLEQSFLRDPSVLTSRLLNLYEEGDVGSISRDEALTILHSTDYDGHPVDHTAHEIWGCLHRFRHQLNRYSNGNISQEEVQNRNRSSFKRLMRLMSNRRSMSERIGVQGDEGGAQKQYFGEQRAYTYSDSVTISKMHGEGVDRLIYGIHAGDLLCLFSPGLKQKQIQRIGGREEDVQSIKSAVPRGSLTSEQMNVLAWCIKGDADGRCGESAAHLVAAQLNHPQPQPATSSTPLLSDVQATISSLLPSVVLELGSLVKREIEEEAPGTPDPLMQSDGAASTSSQEQPAKTKTRGLGALFGFGRGPSDDVDSEQTVRQLAEEPISLVTSHSIAMLPWEVGFDSIVVRSLTLFDLVKRITGRAKTGRLRKGPQHNSLDSTHRHWGMTDPVGGRVRASSDISQIMKPSKSQPAAAHVWVFAFHPEGTQKMFAQEALRYNWLSSRIIDQTLVIDQTPDPASETETDSMSSSGPVPDAAISGYSPDLCGPAPFHSPLVRYGKRIQSYRRKYRHVVFVSLSDVIYKPSLLVRAVATASAESRATLRRSTSGSIQPHPIILLSMADLADSSGLIDLLRSHYTDCSVLFVPTSLVRPVALRLMTVFDQNAKQLAKQLAGRSKVAALASISRYGSRRLIIRSIIELRKEFNIPMILFGIPPQDDASDALSGEEEVFSSVAPIDHGSSSDEMEA